MAEAWFVRVGVNGGARSINGFAGFERNTSKYKKRAARPWYVFSNVRWGAFANEDVKVLRTARPCSAAELTRLTGLTGFDIWRQLRQIRFRSIGKAQAFPSTYFVPEVQYL